MTNTTIFHVGDIVERTTEYRQHTVGNYKASDPDEINRYVVTRDWNDDYAPGTIATLDDGDLKVKHPATGKNVWIDPATVRLVRRWSETATETQARPLIDFSGDSRATAREYASSLLSKVLKKENIGVIHAIAAGQEVDAYAANAAVLDAMRTVSTRFGQSMQRREYGKRAAHLGHIVQAVLESHADGLPAYEQGQRSRKIEQQASIIDSHQGRIRDLEAALEEAQAAEGEKAEKLDDLLAEIQTLTEANAALEERKASNIERLERQAATILEQDKALARLEAFRAYVLDAAAADAPSLARLKGFEDGYKAQQAEDD